MTQRVFNPGLAEALPHPVWTFRPDGMLEYANASLRNYLGFDPELNLAVA